MAQLVANRYAKAMFQLALENGQLDTYTEQLSVVLDTFKTEHEFSKIINHPEISHDKKFSMLEKVFGSVVVPDVLGLFAIIIRKGREKEIINILEAFVNMSKKHRGIVTAYVYGPVALTETQLSSIKARLSQYMNKQVEIQFELQTDLIGGLRIIADGKIMDGTIKKQLDDMKTQLLNLQLV